MPSRPIKSGNSGNTALMEAPALQGERERVFNALAKNGTVRMPIQQTFWAARFGMLVDQFGIPWMINCDRQQAA